MSDNVANDNRSLDQCDDQVMDEKANQFYYQHEHRDPWDFVLQLYDALGAMDRTGSLELAVWLGNFASNRVPKDAFDKWMSQFGPLERCLEKWRCVCSWSCLRPESPFQLARLLQSQSSERGTYAISSLPGLDGAGAAFAIVFLDTENSVQRYRILNSRAGYGVQGSSARFATLADLVRACPNSLQHPLQGNPGPMSNLVGSPTPNQDPNQNPNPNRNQHQHHNFASTTTTGTAIASCAPVSPAAYPRSSVAPAPAGAPSAWSASSSSPLSSSAVADPASVSVPVTRLRNDQDGRALPVAAHLDPRHYTVWVRLGFGVQDKSSDQYRLFWEDGTPLMANQLTDASHCRAQLDTVAIGPPDTLGVAEDELNKHRSLLKALRTWLKVLVLQVYRVGANAPELCFISLLSLDKPKQAMISIDPAFAPFLLGPIVKVQKLPPPPAAVAAARRDTALPIARFCWNHLPALVVELPQSWSDVDKQVPVLRLAGQNHSVVHVHAQSVSMFPSFTTASFDMAQIAAAFPSACSQQVTIVVRATLVWPQGASVPYSFVLAATPEAPVNPSLLLHVQFNRETTCETLVDLTPFVSMWNTASVQHVVKQLSDVIRTVPNDALIPPPYLEAMSLARQGRCHAAVNALYECAGGSTF